ncbi:MAG: NAD(P)-binding domain-containing protein, partial [Candidatus Zixiibacteriota bacterium]
MIPQAKRRKTPALSTETYAVLGYGSQGRALAKNLRDSSSAVIIGLPGKSKSRRRAGSDGFNSITTVSRAVQSATAIIFAFPDHLHQRVFKKDITPHLRDSQALIFLHGMSVHFNLITPPMDVDVMLLAPHGPGLAVREKYLS